MLYCENIWFAPAQFEPKHRSHCPPPPTFAKLSKLNTGDADARLPVCPQTAGSSLAERCPSG
jgi:hypothetical protein